MIVMATITSSPGVQMETRGLRPGSGPQSMVTSDQGSLGDRDPALRPPTASRASESDGPCRAALCWLCCLFFSLVQGALGPGWYLQTFISTRPTFPSLRELAPSSPLNWSQLFPTREQRLVHEFMPLSQPRDTEQGDPAALSPDVH